MAEAANLTRDFANEPSNALTPPEMAERAKALAKKNGLQCEVFNENQLAEMGMGALLGVGSGSDHPCRFVVLRYKGSPKSKRKTVGLLGKGITFDSGGISIKPAAGMESMKGDMSGAAAIIAAMCAIGQLKPKLNVTALLPLAENMPSGSATKPGDILTTMDGKTIEVLNTDAEGRLILSDAICYANREDLSPIVDVATLTGAMMIALGPGATGYFANDERLAERIKSAGDSSGELMWRFPLIADYSESLRSNVADIKNIGPREGGAINAASFLEFFVDKGRPWAHIDMAGTDESNKEKGMYVKGSTGIPARTLVNLVLSMAER
jgi:leucyl aminopeptidase